VASIRLERLRKAFGPVVAVDNLSLEIPNGEFAALLGPSGCGKTTTMNMIAGLEVPTSGSIYFNEKPVTGVPAGKRGVGFVFQNYAIFTHMTVGETLVSG
jgi:multiple sugar transport system ATP-binding protein